MWLKIGAIFLSALAWLAALYLARKQGASAERVRAIKAEAERKFKEQERANAITKRVDDKPIDSVRERLQNTHRD